MDAADERDGFLRALKLLFFYLTDISTGEYQVLDWLLTLLLFIQKILQITSSVLANSLCEVCFIGSVCKWKRQMSAKIDFHVPMSHKQRPIQFLQADFMLWISFSWLSLRLWPLFDKLTLVSICENLNFNRLLMKMVIWLQWAANISLFTFAKLTNDGTNRPKITQIITFRCKKQG